MQLPPLLRHTLEHYATSYIKKELETAALAISSRYRRLEKNTPLLGITSGAEAMAYGATRLPATYCAMNKALDALKHSLPDFSPKSLLDVGAGPATASLAALEQYPLLDHVMLIEPNPYLMTLGQKLLYSIHPDITSQWHHKEITSHICAEHYDLLMCGYVLNEVAQEKGQEACAATVKKLWQATTGVLVIVEPGTPAGYANLMQVRQILIEEGAHIAAPCTHSYICPLMSHAPQKWCHFNVRVERSKLHREIKQDATLNYEDEKFSYLIASRLPPQKVEHRLIGHPRGTKIVEVDTCLSTGDVQHLKIGKSHPHYKTFRKAQWGDGIIK